MPGKWFLWTNISSSLFPKEIKDKVQPAIKMFTDGWNWMILVNSGYSQILVSEHVSWFWQREVKVLTANEKTLKCHGNHKIKLKITHAQPVHVNGLIVDSHLLRFNFLGIYTIRELGGVYIARSVEMRFPEGKMPRCVAISINELDFSAEFGHHKKVWIAI